MDKLIDAVEAGPAIHLDAESTALRHSVSLNCKVRVDPELVLLCQKHGDAPHRGTRIGRMREIWPFAALKNHVVEQTKEFVRQMRVRGYESQQPESLMELWGPFREKVDISNTGLVNVEAGNPFFPEGRWVNANRGVREIKTKGPQQITRRDLLDSSDWEKGAIFLVRGRFIATRGKQDDQTGILLV